MSRESKDALVSIGVILTFLLMCGMIVFSIKTIVSTNGVQHYVTKR